MSEGDLGQKPARIVGVSVSGSYDVSNPQLTPRQIQVMELSQRGYSVRTTAEELGIGVQTVKNHRSEIMRRLGVHELIDSAINLDDYRIEAIPVPIEPVPITIPIYDDSAPLSPRQSEVVTLSGNGFSEAEIAEQLNISEHTVKNHLTNARDRLGAETTIDALAVAVQKGDISESSIAPGEFDPTRFELLSPRQRQVYYAIVSDNGYVPYKELARRFGIKEQTFKKLAGKVFRKLGLNNRVQAEAVNIKLNYEKTSAG